jgi:hypothetical protein
MTAPLSRNDTRLLDAPPAGLPYTSASRSAGVRSIEGNAPERGEAELVARVKRGEVEAFYGERYLNSILPARVAQGKLLE